MKKTISILLAVALLAVCLVVPITAANHPFTDVSDNAWYAGNVEFVYEKGLMAGTAADKFSPETKMNRAMLVTVLYRMDGSKEASGTTPFTDVKTGEYYYPALVWAYGNGIINGTAPDKFSPEAPITREMMVTIFYRYAQFKGLDVSKTDNLSKFTDAGKISGYAKEPFQWAVAAGVIYGNTETTLNPLGTATRAECAAILQRFYTLANGSSEETDPEKELTGIYLILADDVKVSYIVGEELDLTGVTVLAGYSDGTEEEVTDYTYSVDMSVEGHQMVEISYKGYTVSYGIDIWEEDGRHLQGISVKLDDNAVINYPLGATEVDLTGVHVTAHYDDATWEEVFDFTAEFDGATDRAGNILVIVKYQDVKTDYMVRIILPESMRYNMEEARDVANAYALELGFEAVDVSMTSENSCACNSSVMHLSHAYVESNGGQDYLNEMAKQTIQFFQETVKLNAEENDEIPDDAWKHLTVNVYVSWDDPMQGYVITVLYRGE